MPSKRKDAQYSTPNEPPPKKLKESHVYDSEFRVVKSSLVLSVPPVFAANPRAGVEEMLDSMIMRYISSLEGVVLSHSNLNFTNKAAVIQGDCPFLICNVAFDATLWSPRVGAKLVGKVNLCSPDHISLLVHRTFNVSIPRHHIPIDTWEFEYGPAENDPEFAPEIQHEDKVTEDDKDPDTNHDSGGKWVHKVTGEVLGGPTALLEFTVIGLTVANEMLSLLGSLQPDPFSPLHIVHQSESKKADQDASETEHDVLDDLDEEDSGLEEVEADDSESDTFQSLGKRKDVHDLQIKASEERAASGKKKRKV